MRSYKKRFSSLEELRQEKGQVEKCLSIELTKFQKDVVDSFMPERSYIDSSIPYMRYIGYGMTAYRTAKVVKNIFDFIHRRSWR